MLDTYLIINSIKEIDWLTSCFPLSKHNSWSWCLGSQVILCKSNKITHLVKQSNHLDVRHVVLTHF